MNAIGLRRRKRQSGLRTFPFAALMGGSFVPVNTETSTWKTAVVGDGGSVSDARLQIVDTLITSYKNNSLWTKVDRLWLLAAENSQSALRDIANTVKATLTNAPTFTANQGYAGNGSTSFIDTGYVPATNAVNLSLNSGSFFMYIRTSRTAAAFGHGVLGANSDAIQMLPCFTGNANNSLVNSTAGGSSSTDANVQGQWIVSRTAANTVAYYKNGSADGTSAQGSGALPTTRSMYICARNNSSADLFSTDQVAIYGMAAGLSATDAGNLDAANNAYMTSLGTNVY